MDTFSISAPESQSSQCGCFVGEKQQSEPLCAWCKRFDSLQPVASPGWYCWICQGGGAGLCGFGRQYPRASGAFRLPLQELEKNIDYIELNGPRGRQGVPQYQRFHRLYRNESMAMMLDRRASRWQPVPPVPLEPQAQLRADGDGQNHVQSTAP